MGHKCQMKTIQPSLLGQRQNIPKMIGSILFILEPFYFSSLTTKRFIQKHFKRKIALNSENFEFCEKCATF